MGGNEGKSAGERARDLVRGAIEKVNLDAVRRFTTKRASGEHRAPGYVPSDGMEHYPLPLRRCRACYGEVIEGDEPQSRMGPERLCSRCKRESGPHAVPELPPAA